MKALNIGTSVGPDAEVVVNEKGAGQSKMEFRFDLIPSMANFALAEILHHGAEKYGVDNWRDIPDPQEHLNHSLVHAYAWLHGDNSEGTPLDQLARAYTRMGFALEMEILRIKAGGKQREEYKWTGESPVLKELHESQVRVEEAMDEVTRLSDEIMSHLKSGKYPSRAVHTGEISDDDRVDHEVLMTLRAQEVGDTLTKRGIYMLAQPSNVVGLKQVGESLKRLKKIGMVDQVKRGRWALTQDTHALLNDPSRWGQGKLTQPDPEQPLTEKVKVTDRAGQSMVFAWQEVKPTVDYEDVGRMSLDDAIETVRKKRGLKSGARIRLNAEETAWVNKVVGGSESATEVVPNTTLSGRVKKKPSKRKAPKRRSKKIPSPLKKPASPKRGTAKKAKTVKRVKR